MFVSQNARCGNVTILAMKMYDMLTQGNKNESLGFRISKMV